MRSAAGTSAVGSEHCVNGLSPVDAWLRGRLFSKTPYPTSVAACSHRLLENATPKTCDQNRFAVTME